MFALQSKQFMRRDCLRLRRTAFWQTMTGTPAAGAPQSSSVNGRIQKIKSDSR